MKKNVYLVDLASGSNMNLLPLAIGFIGEYSKLQPEITDVFNIEYRYLRQTGKELFESMDKPEIVGFSCYVWNFRGSLAAARALKQLSPTTKIVLGGFSIPKHPDRVKEFFTEHPYVDFLVHGEGEITFANFLKAYGYQQKLEEVAGITFQSPDYQEGYFSNPKADRIIDLDAIPSPFLNGMFDGILKTYGDQVTGALWETNRGCPYQCTFCDWGNADVSRIKIYDMDRLREEINWVSRNKFYYMFMSDANFGIFPERDYQIAEMIADLHEKTGSPHHVVTNWAKNKGENVVRIAERLAKGGVASNITMAIQSTNPDTLKAIKRKNLARGEMDKLKSLFHDRYIPTYVEVILGLPLETYESWSQGLNQILSNRLEDRFFVYLCQMLENTELASPEQRELYQLDTRLCKHTVSNRKFSWTDENTEYEEFIVGNSTMPVPDWVRGYVLGYFLTVLYNHRAAIFPIMYLHNELDVLPVDYVEYVIQRLREKPESYPFMKRSLAHIDKQAELMLDSVSTMNDLPEADGLVVLPAVGSLVLFAKDSAEGYVELYELTKEFCASRGIKVNEEVLTEVFRYQKARFPGWLKNPEEEFDFSYNLPEYFFRLTEGLEKPEITKRTNTVRVRDHRRDFSSFAEFAATLVRGGLTVDLLEVEFEEAAKVLEGEKKFFFKSRRSMEQRNIDKLKAEFDRIKSS